MKSALLCAYLASYELTPIEEQERNIWLTNTERPFILSQIDVISIVNSTANSFIVLLFVNTSLRYIYLM